MRISFNDDNSPKGIEGWYEIIDGRLTVYLNPTNSKIDWIIDILAIQAPVDWTSPGLGLCHVGFKYYAAWLVGKVDTLVDLYDINKILLSGYSMGGGIAQLAGLMLQQRSKISCEILSIDGPATTTKRPDNFKLVYNRGSLVHSLPPWFLQAKDRECLNEKWEPFWISHGNYNIESILKKAS